jgi:hypothetical protein
MVALADDGGGAAGASGSHRRAEDQDMAKGQMRSGREPKKPKGVKKPPAATASPFSREPTSKAPPSKK